MSLALPLPRHAGQSLQDVRDHTDAYGWPRGWHRSGQRAAPLWGTTPPKAGFAFDRVTVLMRRGSQTIPVTQIVPQQRWERIPNYM